jgi:DNA (cytosine-5)-methyltransferase 1
MILNFADLFCGGGGTSQGAAEAAVALGYQPRITAVNHWNLAIETHAANHPSARHYCARVDSLKPTELFGTGELDVLWASPECTHHSRARAGAPIQDQSRATAWDVVQWAASLRPSVVFVENVVEFEEWGPLDDTAKPIPGRKGEVFKAWINALRSYGYTVDWRVLCAADFGDPTSRRRLFVQAVRQGRKIVWPNPTHSRSADLFGRPLWRSAQDAVIDWSIPATPIAKRSRALRPKTLQWIRQGLERFGGSPFLVAMEHKGRTISADQPVPTVTCARGGAIGVAFLISYYGTGGARPISEPLPTVTCKARFGLVQASLDEVAFRMLRPHEYAAAQGFPAGYQFCGTIEDQVRQIGNAVPCGFGRALVGAHLLQSSDVSSLVRGIAA